MLLEILECVTQVTEQGNKPITKPNVTWSRVLCDIYTGGNVLFERLRNSDNIKMLRRHGRGVSFCN